MDLKAKIKKLPSSPGVYLMKDSQNSVIYVGKSRNLKNRVSSYFVNSKSHSPKVVKLVNNLKDFDYILTDTEFEAFMLECKLIKSIKPIYNKKMKNPMSYVYVRINTNRNNPGIWISNNKDDSDGSLYFGPYSNRNTVERGIQGIKEECRILCSNNSKKYSQCLNYSMGLCIGTCLGEPVIEEYTGILDKITKLLNGADREILDRMEKNMNNATSKLDFENAAKYRDYINATRYLISSAKAAKFTRANKHIVLIEYIEENTFKFFLIKGSKVLFSDKYIIDGFEHLKLINILKRNILFYFREADIAQPLEISKFEIDEAHIIYSYIKKKENACRYIIIPESWIQKGLQKNIIEALNSLLTV